MGMKTGIEWTDHTLNFWWGCFKVSPGCTHCYAETFSRRVGRNIWGPSQATERWRTKGPWQDCLKWDRQAKADGVRRRAFCQSMSDFFEDHPQVEPWRKEAMAILESFEWIDVQLLTKRPENVLKMVPDGWLENWPRHIWIGTSVENQEYADKRIPELLKIPATVRFLSCEPLLGPVDLGRWLCCPWCGEGQQAIQDTMGVWYHPDRFGGMPCPTPKTGRGSAVHNIDWVIAGGESGPQARPMHPDWAWQVRDQCTAARVAFFFKQWGRFCPTSESVPGRTKARFFEADGKPANPDIPFSQIWARGGFQMWDIGKHAAGRLLDGRTWEEFPAIASFEPATP